MSAINPWTGPQWKEGRTKAKRERVNARAKRGRAEKENKAESKRRDGHRCRFPLCGCRKFGLRLESSHQEHKGAGGDPKGVRSDVDNLITLCFHRHQDGRVSRHKGTMQVRPLTRAGTNGRVAFDIELETLNELRRLCGYRKLTRDDHGLGKAWVQVAREKAVQDLEPLQDWQRDVLELLAACEL